MVGGTFVVGALVVVIVLGEIGAGEAARGLGLALFFLVWPLFFLAVAPPAKPGLDPVTAQYYVKPGTLHSKPVSTGDSDPSGSADTTAP